MATYRMKVTDAEATEVTYELDTVTNQVSVPVNAPADLVNRMRHLELLRYLNNFLLVAGQCKVEIEEPA